MRKTLALMLLLFIIAVGVGAYEYKDENGYNLHLDFTNGGAQVNTVDTNQSIVIGGTYILPFNSTGVGYDIHQGTLYILWSNINLGVDVTAPSINCSIIYRGVEWGEINCTSNDITAIWSMSIKENETQEFVYMFDPRTEGERKFLGLKEGQAYIITVNVSDTSGNTGTKYISLISKWSGEVQGMSFVVGLFLIIINIGVFLTPIFVKNFAPTPAGNHVIKHLFWIAGVFLLWFNSTIFRIIAQNYSMGIDDMLLAMWYFLTVVCIGLILVIVYVMTKGAIMMIKEAKVKRRMGYEEQTYTH